MKCQQVTAGTAACFSTTSVHQVILETSAKKHCSLHPLQPHFAQFLLIASALAAPFPWQPDQIHWETIKEDSSEVKG